MVRDSANVVVKGANLGTHVVNLIAKPSVVLVKAVSSLVKTRVVLVKAVSSLVKTGVVLVKALVVEAKGTSSVKKSSLNSGKDLFQDRINIVVSDTMSLSTSHDLNSRTDLVHDDRSLDILGFAIADSSSDSLIGSLTSVVLANLLIEMITDVFHALMVLGIHLLLTELNITLGNLAVYLNKSGIVLSWGRKAGVTTKSLKV